jgi:hypothetical protein
MTDSFSKIKEKIICILFKNKLIKPTTGMCDNIIQLQNEYCISQKRKKGTKLVKQMHRFRFSQVKLVIDREGRVWEGPKGEIKSLTDEEI